MITTTLKHYFGVYGEDSWQVGHGLTVNYGLRWEYIPNWYEKQNKSSDTFIAGEQSKVFQAPRGIRLRRRSASRRWHHPKDRLQYARTTISLLGLALLIHRITARLASARPTESSTPTMKGRRSTRLQARRRSLSSMTRRLLPFWTRRISTDRWDHPSKPLPLHPGDARRYNLQFRTVSAAECVSFLVALQPHTVRGGLPLYDAAGDQPVAGRNHRIRR